MLTLKKDFSLPAEVIVKQCSEQWAESAPLRWTAPPISRRARPWRRLCVTMKHDDTGKLAALKDVL